MRNDGSRGATGATTVGLLTATGAETVYDTTIIIHYAINGKGERKAAVTDGATPTTDQNTGAAFNTLAASEGCVLVWCLNAAGTVSIAQSEVKALDSSNAFPEPDGIPDFPDIDLDTYCPFAYSVLKNGSTGSTFTIGSSNWNATGMTATHQDVLFGLPSRPQSS